MSAEGFVYIALCMHCGPVTLAKKNLLVCSEVNRCYDEAENFHVTFLGQTQAKDAFLLALKVVSPDESIVFSICTRA